MCKEFFLILDFFHKKELQHYHDMHLGFWIHIIVYAEVIFYINILF